MKLKVQCSSLVNKTLVICAQGINVGFMPILYSTAKGIKGVDGKPLLTSAYLSCTVFDERFEYGLIDCDERQVVFPHFGDKPNLYDSSIEMIAQADEHIVLGSLDNELAKFNHEASAQKAEVDPNFQFRIITI